MIRAALLCLLLAGCATEPKIIKVPVATPCLSDTPKRPEYRYGKGPMPSPAEAAKRLATDFEAADQYGREWEAAAAGCVLIGKVSPPTNMKGPAP